MQLRSRWYFMGMDAVVSARPSDVVRKADTWIGEGA
jgi:hypothetical protein